MTKIQLEVGELFLIVCYSNQKNSAMLYCFVLFEHCIIVESVKGSRQGSLNIITQPK